MPEAKKERKMMRETFLSASHWKRIGFTIKIVFLVASKNESLIEEIEKFDDILLINSEESHYNLPSKDYHFLKFIDEKCRDVLKKSHFYNSFFFS